jgi:uncharacterized membrane protein
MRTHVLVSAVLCCFAIAAAAPGQQLVTMPNGSWATDVTPDGEIVAGSYAYVDGFIWRWRVDPAPTIITGGTIVAISDDGTVAAGNIIDPGVDANVAAIWTQATGWQSLGWLPGALSCPSRSDAYAISGDGSTVVGLSWVGCNARGFRWTAATGMQELQVLGDGNNRCSAISSDGSVLGGFADPPGFWDRSPAYWQADTSGTLLAQSPPGEVAGFNSNGSTSVGEFSFPGQVYLRAFVRDASTGAMTNLGALHFNWNSSAEDISEDGRTVVGFDYISLSRQAWVSTSTDGMISLDDRLTAMGFTDFPPMLVCRAVSDDGSVVVGGAAGVNPFDGVGFIVELVGPSQQWTDLGNGLAGTNGIPALAGTGPLTAGSTTTVTLSQGKPNSPAAFVVGFSSIYAPFKQGVLVPFPNVLLHVPALAPSGSAELSFAWPDGLPSAFSMYWQVLVSDSAGPAGFALSNALESTTP